MGRCSDRSGLKSCASTPRLLLVDRLSSGRLVLGVGLGDDRFGRELSATGEEVDDRRRGQMLDESLASSPQLGLVEPCTTAASTTQSPISTSIRLPIGTPAYRYGWED